MRAGVEEPVTADVVALVGAQRRLPAESSVVRWRGSAVIGPSASCSEEPQL